MSVLAALDICHDDNPQSGAMNMAIDEALLEVATVPLIRFYSWASPALSFGYFGTFDDVAGYASERDLVRRWTGGGVVFHGEDLTYSIVIPASDLAFAESSMSIYENVHRALADALASNGERAELAAVAAVCDRRIQTDSAVADRRYTYCFTNPVRADVMVDGHKIAGAAQRRTRRGLLQQGSIRHVDLSNGLAKRFAKELCGKCSERKIDDGLLDRAGEIAAQKYATAAWLQRR